jgi:formyl-CoA transferase
MDRPDLADDERYATHGARGRHAETLDGEIAAWTSELTAEEALQRLEAHAVPAGRIFTAREMLTDPHYAAREMVERVLSEQGWDVPMTGVVPKFGRTPGAVRTAGPPLGGQTRDVLREVARMSGEEIDELLGAGLVG